MYYFNEYFYDSFPLTERLHLPKADKVKSKKKKTAVKKKNKKNNRHEKTNHK